MVWKAGLRKDRLMNTWVYAMDIVGIDQCATTHKFRYRAVKI